ncbi:hypothetical protein F442_09002 [Phytophthora nicotianae P10297]|uniref:Uncharacterized protein n=2 Tax=Phytophthora nicotianae TaxID=4792 RepID=W2ZBE9_PHYNI|nr:hypothetical protein L917_08729 [Phytophthora nicotianae]ETP44400.1 hypothetical protein F442_09002 [Phytophthora nicotianae P10297]
MSDESRMNAFQNPDKRFMLLRNEDNKLYHSVLSRY